MGGGRRRGGREEKKGKGKKGRNYKQKYIYIPTPIFPRSYFNP
jgi:hypothetical protein